MQGPLPPRACRERSSVVMVHEPGVGKCYTEDPSAGKIVGKPTCDHVVTYAWVYSWPKAG